MAGMNDDDHHHGDGDDHRDDSAIKMPCMSKTMMVLMKRVISITIPSVFCNLHHFVHPSALGKPKSHAELDPEHPKPKRERLCYNRLLVGFAWPRRTAERTPSVEECQKISAYCSPLADDAKQLVAIMTSDVVALMSRTGMATIGNGTSDSTMSMVF